MTSGTDDIMKDEGTAGDLAAMAPAPNAIYFYYIKRPVQTGAHDGAAEDARHTHGEIRAFLYNNKGNESITLALVHKLIRMVSDGDLIPVGYAMSDLAFRHRAKMLFVWDEENYTLEDVKFTFAGEMTNTNECQYMASPGNHPSFDDFTSVRVSSSFSYVHGTNKRLRADGRPLGPCAERFRVDFIPKPRGFIHDESATNIGP